MKKVVCFVLFSIVFQLQAAEGFCPVSLVPEINACEGETVTLDGTTTASGYTYQWFKDGTVLPNETNATLLVTQAGLYRVEATNGPTLCFSESTVAFLDAPDITSPTPLQVCDEDNDGFTSFDLTVKDSEITNGNPDYIVLYFLTQADSQNNVNPLISPYTNTINPQTLFVRVEDVTTSCTSFTTLELQVIILESGIPNDITVEDPDNDGIAVFDLTVNDVILLNGQNSEDFSINYFVTQADALNDSNAISNPGQFTNSVNPQTIYTRIASLLNSCFDTSSFNITAEFMPAPDEDNDGVPDEDEDINNNGNLEDDDTDGDSLPNYRDSDDDGDLVETIDEITGIGAGRLLYGNRIFIDTDEDMIENYLDDDDDGDLVLTKDEDYNGNGNPIDDDTNGNNIPDFLDAEAALGVDEVFVNSLRLFPNPTASVVTISSPQLGAQFRIVIYNAEGKIVQENETVSQVNRATISLSALKTGVYFLKVVSEEKQAILQFIKV
ncbi:T9SS type A sorting domain-containing protein [Jejudonia soesokkakensis]|uniref:T9SS type A sorting domain-containing protein n=1 Tax=Jejudonia soesokkakensis TaxID=1323432 RepID=A0ABW2MU53_9FLAO